MSKFKDVLSRPIAREARVSDLTGFAAGTLILTLDGELPVEHLCAGDRVITRSGARILKRITAAVVDGSYVISAHTLGHDRPEATVTVGPKQKILLRDWRARALYDRAEAAAPVARLADGEFIRKADGPVRIFSMEFAAEETIYAGGLEAVVPAQKD